MADLSDVETTLTSMIMTMLYPGGARVPSITGQIIKIFRGWPSPIGLNADLAASTSNVTVFSDPKTTRETTRYPRLWRTRQVVPVTLGISVQGNVATVAGVCSQGQIAGVEIDGSGLAVAVTDADTPASIAARLAAQSSLAVVSGASITFASTGRIVGRVVGSGQATMETRRQQQDFIVSVWCPTPETRDSISIVLDTGLSAVDWLQFEDGSAGQIRYRATVEVDTSQNASLYRRDLIYSVEYPTILTETTAGMLFGGLSIEGAVAGTTPTNETSGPISQPKVGAIRFDAWYDPEDTIDQQCATALSAGSWSDRYPANAVVSGNTVNWPLADQPVIDAEIAAAITAGLGFWAFDSYQPADGLSRALSLYLSSQLRNKLQFCMLGQASNWADPSTSSGYSAIIARDISMMAEPGYLTVLGGRPVYFVLDAIQTQLSMLPAGGISQALVFVRQQAASSGLANPYIVWLSAAALADYDNVSVAREIGADAAGAYACPRLNGQTQPYSALVEMAETDWTDRAKSGLDVVATAMAGWDQRPLIETPQPFYPIATGVSPADYYETGTADEIACHVSDVAAFTAANVAACRSGLALVYAWNELVEGGWLVPTLSQSGPDNARVQAIGQKLSSMSPDAEAAKSILV